MVWEEVFEVTDLSFEVLSLVVTADSCITELFLLRGFRFEVNLTFFGSEDLFDFLGRVETLSTFRLDKLDFALDGPLSERSGMDSILS